QSWLLEIPDGVIPVDCLNRLIISLQLDETSSSASSMLFICEYFLVDKFLYRTDQFIIFNQTGFELFKIQLVVPVQINREIFRNTNRHCAAANFLNQMKFQIKTACGTSARINIFTFGDDGMRLDVHFGENF